MIQPATLSNPMRAARLAGAFYLAIIVLGITSEVALRGALVVPGDAARTATNILGAPGLLRASFAADMIMAMADVALGVLLFVLLRPVNAVAALMALVFRLMQAGLIAVSQLVQFSALLLLESQGTRAADQALFAMNVQAHGYDLGLVFFGINSLLTGYLLVRSGYLPRLIGWLVAAAGIVYLVGSALRFMAPGLLELFLPAYGIPLIAESAFCLWLLIRGLRVPSPDRG